MAAAKVLEIEEAGASVWLFRLGDRLSEICISAKLL